MPIILYSLPSASGRPPAAAEPVAQLVEHRTFNPWVVGSIPTGLNCVALLGLMTLSLRCRDRRSNAADRSFCGAFVAFQPRALMPAARRDIDE
jgi:hypothetical protein